MTDTTAAWTRVSERFSALALKLKLHAQEELSDEDLDAKVGVERVRAVVGEMVDALQDAYEDEAVRADAREAGRALVDAVDATIRDVQEGLQSGGRQTPSA